LLLWGKWIKISKYLQATFRNIVETTVSMTERLLPKSIHSVTPQGFDLKAALFIMAVSLNYLWLQFG